MPHQLHNFGLAAVDSAIADAEFAGYGMHLLTATSTNHLAHQPPITLRTYPHIPLLNWGFALGHFVRSAMLDVSASREKHQREFSV